MEGYSLDVSGEQILDLEHLALGNDAGEARGFGQRLLQETALEAASATAASQSAMPVVIITIELWTDVEAVSSRR